MEGAAEAVCSLLSSAGVWAPPSPSAGAACFVSSAAAVAGAAFSSLLSDFPPLLADFSAFSGATFSSATALLSSSVPPSSFFKFFCISARFLFWDGPGGCPAPVTEIKRPGILVVTVTLLAVTVILLPKRKSALSLPFAA